MSGTSPKDQDALLAGYVQPVTKREPRQGAELWRLVNREHVLACELLDDSAIGAGFEIRLRKDDEIILGRRRDTQALAEYVAKAFEEDARRTGYSVAEDTRTST
jgi:hypothetical protein